MKHLFYGLSAVLFFAQITAGQAATTPVPSLAPEMPVPQQTAPEGIVIAQVDCLRDPNRRGPNGRAVWNCAHTDDSGDVTTYSGSPPRPRRYFPGRDINEGPMRGSSDPGGICSNAANMSAVNSDVVSICRNLGWVF